MSYSKEEHEIDKAVIDCTRGMLSARIIGERFDECDGMLPNYVEITERLEKDLNLMSTASKMFQNLVQPKCDPFKVEAYDKLLRQIKTRLGLLRLRRRKKAQTCLQVELHSQPCFCANYARFKESQLLEAVEESI